MTSNLPATAERPVTTIDYNLLEQVLLKGDLQQLSAEEKVNYYRLVCESVGLNPLTKPFSYTILSGKEVLYASKGCADQLRRIHNVDIKIVGRELVDDCYVVTARASMPSGRGDEDSGVVPIANLKGEFRANAMMKATTKAKRRVTLSICGLGMLDETEVETIPGAGRAPRTAAAPDTVDVQPTPASPEPSSDDAPKKPTPPIWKSDRNGNALVIDPVTGEEVKLTPPEGFHFIWDYKMRGPAHVGTIRNFDGQGGAVEISTIYEPAGPRLKRAAIDHLAVKVKTAPMKPDTPGKLYVNDVEFFNTDLPF